MLSSSRLKLSLRTSALASALLPCAAFCQVTAPGVGTGQPATPAEAAPAQDASDAQGGLSEIVVTAQRRSENLQRTGLAVSAVSSEDIAKANLTDVTSLTKLVPSLIAQPTVGTAVGFYLRGVGTYVGNAYTDSPVALNFGPVYIARPSAALGTFYDLERVEVLKGPQGTLYGRNATGGAVNVIPRQPKLDTLGADLSIEAGNYKSIRTQAAVNLPLGDNAALRVAGQIAHRDGYLSDGSDDEVGQAARASLLYEPSGAVKVNIVADYFHQGGRGIGGVLVPGPLTPTAPDPDKRIGGADPLSIAALRAAFPVQINGGLVSPPQRNSFVNNENWGVYSTVDVDLGFATLTVIPAYRDNHPDFLAYTAGYSARIDETSKQKSVEARLASSGSGRFNYVVGGYYFDEDQHSFNRFFQGLLLDTTIDASLRNKSYAVFGQASFALTHAFRLIAGARQTWEDKSNDTLLTQKSFNTGPTSTIDNDASFKKFTYKAGVEWDAGSHNLVYASVATGFKSGGFFPAAIDNVYQPENITAYTVGAKNRFLDNRLQLNVEAFYWKYKDQQVNFIGPVRTSATTFGSALVTANAGRSRIQGAEADLLFQLTPQDLFGANLQYLDTRYQRFSILLSSANGAPPRSGCAVSLSNAIALPPPGRVFLIDCSGKPSVNAPKWSLNLSYEHTFELSGSLNLAVGGRTKIESARFLGLEYLPEERQGGYMQSDLYATLASPGKRWSLTAFVNNVEDKTVYGGSTLRPVLPVVYNILRPPRTYGLRASFSY